MRTALPLLCLVLTLSLATPAEAQFRDAAQQSRSVQTQLYDSGSAAANTLQSLLGAEHFRMAHSYQASFSSFGGQASSMGMYTNTMMMQFNSNWAARVDVSVAHPFSQTSAFGQQDTQVFLRNAEVAYKPSENFELRMQVQQSPHGRYMSPYGRYRRGGFGGAHGGYGFSPTPTGDLFWRN
ncbi:MAG: hypothetical protein ABEL97_01090 [Salinibacter sp.]